MKILGIDPSTSTGWSLLEDGKVIKYGIIKLEKVSIGERLLTVSKSIKKIIKETKPDLIAVEDIIMAISGVKTLTLLARISGCIIKECYEEVGDNITLFTPSQWKKNSIPGLKGNATKWQIQLGVITHFSFIDKQNLYIINDIIEKELLIQNDIKDDIKILKNKHNQLKKKSRKKHIDEDSSCVDMRQQLEKKIISKKKFLKNIEKSSKKEFIKVGKQITELTNINEDIADSICIAYAKSLQI